MEIRPGILRNPDSAFVGLPGYDFTPHFLEVVDSRLGPLRMHYIDEGASARLSS